MPRDPNRPPVPTILHLDEHLLVVDKPPRVLSVAGRGTTPTVAEMLHAAKLVPAEEPFLVVHRIDRDASGLIVYARTEHAQRHLTEQWVARSVEKVYLALVQGRVKAGGAVDLPISVSSSGQKAEVDPKDGKPSRTLYQVVEAVAGHTLLECRPLTGRLHQIRVHLAAIGHPLAVDPIYGMRTELMLSQYKTGYRTRRGHEERPLISRLTLHAMRITFEHPAGSGSVTFEAEPPKDFRATLKQLRQVSGGA